MMFENRSSYVIACVLIKNINCCIVLYHQLGPIKIRFFFHSKQRSRTSITQKFSHYHNANGFIVHTHKLTLTMTLLTRLSTDWKCFVFYFSYQVRDWFEALRVLTRIFCLTDVDRVTIYDNISEKFFGLCHCRRLFWILSVWSFFWHCWLFEKCNLNPFLTIPCWVSPLCSHLAPSLKIIIDCALFAIVEGKIAF